MADTAQTANWQPFWRELDSTHLATETIVALGLDGAAITQDPDYATLRPMASVMMGTRYRGCKTAIQSNTSAGSSLIYPGAGLCFIADDLELTGMCIEIDRPKVIETKRTLMERFGKHCRNYLLRVADATNWDQIEQAISPILECGNPTTILNIGMVDYFDQAACDSYTDIVIKILGCCPGGVWVSGDTYNKLHIREFGCNFPEMAAAAQRLVTRSGLTKMMEGLFDSPEAMADYYSSYGLTVERHPFSEYASQLVCLDTLGTSAQEAAKLVCHLEVFVMRLK